MILPKEYIYEENGFIKQIEKEKFNYTIEYKLKQGTNKEMSLLRLGWISSFFSYEELSSMNAVDIGCGNYEFIKNCFNKFKSLVGYDVAGDSISKEDLFGTNWDLILLSDVLEHFEDIEDLFKLKWNYCYLSFPETPNFDQFDDMKKWRHFKPNEHLYYLNYLGIKKWVEKHNSIVIGYSNFEDLIRKRWNDNITNISSLMIKRLN